MNTTYRTLLRSALYPYRTALGIDYSSLVVAVVGKDLRIDVHAFVAGCA